MLKTRLKIKGTAGEVDGTLYFSDIGYTVSYQYPQKFPEYLNNLHRLGLVDEYYDRWLTNDKLYASLKSHVLFLQ